MRVTKRMTEGNFISARQSFSNALASFNDLQRVREAESTLDELESILADFDARGFFESDSDERKTYIHRSGKQKDPDEIMKENDAATVAGGRLSIALAGLRLLQKSIPALHELAERCLAVAGKEAVRNACGDTRVNDNQIKSEFSLPAGHAATAPAAAGMTGVFAKVKNALK